MPTVMTHAALGLAVGQALRPARTGHRYWLGCALLPAIPDADVIGFHFGIEYGDVIGHRGLSHSLIFSVLLGFAVAMSMTGWERRNTRDTWRLSFIFILLVASHGPMDMLTNGGLGIALFAPFHNERLFWDWRPILVSPIGLDNFLSAWGWAVVKSELTWFGPPIAAILAAGLVRRRILARH